MDYVWLMGLAVYALGNITPIVIYYWAKHLGMFDTEEDSDTFTILVGVIVLSNSALYYGLLYAGA